MHHPWDPQDVEGMLAYVDSDVPRETWVRIAMAIKSEFPGAEGRTLFENWSSGGQSYNPRDCTDTWKSIKANGETSMGTLVHMARQAGWQGRVPEKTSQAAQETRRRDRQQWEAQEQAESERRCTEAALRAKSDWERARLFKDPDDPDHGYLRRKRCKAYGVRVLDEKLLIPIYHLDEDGHRLVGLQRIDELGNKRYDPGTQKKNGMYWLEGNSEVVFLAEGYATAATIREATECTTILAFDCSNMVTVARKLRELRPKLKIYPCADLDGHLPKNEGVLAAQQAAEILGTTALIPPGQEDQKLDWNDVRCNLEGDRNLELASSEDPPTWQDQLCALLISQASELAEPLGYPRDADDVREGTPGRDWQEGSAPKVGDVETVHAPITPDSEQGIDSLLESNPTGEDIAKEVAKLAELSDLDYERQRAAIAKRLGIRIEVLDKEVKRARSSALSDTSKGRAIELYEPEPWSAPVDGVMVLDEVYLAIKRHMVMRVVDAYAVALWIAHVHVYDQFDHTPRLLITAPDAECGKTLLMSHLVGNMVTRPQSVELMKPAPFFRLAAAHRPCFLIDEMDVFIKEDADLLAAINNGWEPQGGVPRCVGEDFEVRIFPTHCPVVMAGIDLGGKLPNTTVSRSIVINLDRAAAGELPPGGAYNVKLHRPALLNIGRKLARWCRDHVDEISRYEPTLPSGVHNRTADRWAPLFTIAQLAGGDWPGRAEAALAGQQTLSEPSKGLALLHDIREVLHPGEAGVATKDLIRRISDAPDSPWADDNFRERDPERRRITPRQVSTLLKRYKIAPATIRFGRVTKKGYHVAELENAFKRYLASKPHIPPEISVTPSHPSNDEASSEIPSVTLAERVTDTISREPSNGAGCYDVTDNEGGHGETEDVMPSDSEFEEIF